MKLSEGDRDEEGEEEEDEDVDGCFLKKARISMYFKSPKSLSLSRLRFGLLRHPSGSRLRPGCGVEGARNSRIVLILKNKKLLRINISYILIIGITFLD